MGNVISDPLATITLQTAVNPNQRIAIAQACPAFFQFSFTTNISQTTWRIINFMTSHLPNPVVNRIIGHALAVAESIRATVANETALSNGSTKQNLLANLQLALDRLDTDNITATMSTENSFGIMLEWALIRDLTFFVDANC